MKIEDLDRYTRLAIDISPQANHDLEYAVLDLIRILAKVTYALREIDNITQKHPVLVQKMRIFREIQSLSRQALKEIGT